jgi:hypothetical protein
MKKVTMSVKDYARAIILVKLTIKKAKIALEFQKDSSGDLCNFADGTVLGLTNNTNITTVPVVIGPVTNPLSIAGLTAAVRSILQKIASGNKSATLTTDLAQAVNNLMQALTSNGHSVEDQANTLAAGILEKAQGIITSTGYKLKKKGQSHPRTFEALKSDKGTIHVRVKAAGKGRAAYIIRYGITTAENIQPTTLSPSIVNLETELIVTGLKSGTIIGIQYASVLPVSHTTKTSSTSINISSKSTAIATTKSHKAIYAHGTEPLLWSYFIYVIVS